MNVKRIAFIRDTIMEKYPFPRDIEIGFTYESKYETYWEIGDNYQVFLEWEGYFGSFHTHPEDSCAEFSEGDIHQMIINYHKEGYLGYLNELVFVDLNKIDMRTQYKIGIYRKNPSDDLLSIIAKSINSQLIKIL